MLLRYLSCIQRRNAKRDAEFSIFLVNIFFPSLFNLETLLDIEPFIDFWSPANFLSNIFAYGGLWKLRISFYSSWVAFSIFNRKITFTLSIFY